MLESTNSQANEVPGTNGLNEQIIFWDGNGKIVPHLLYEYFGSIGIGNYFSDNSNTKNGDPILVKINGNVVCPINVGYLLDITKNYILKTTQENGNSGSILDSLHSRTSLFSDKNLKLLPTLTFEFIHDTSDSGFFFFKNGVVKVTGEFIELHPFEEFDQYVWESSIIPIDFEIIDLVTLEANCDFMKFFKDLTIVNDSGQSSTRFKALSSAIGYLIHRHKDAATTKAIILMDVYINGMPNGGSGKTLLIIAVKRVRNLSIIDGKKYDQKEWFGLSSVQINTEVLLFDDIVKNFNFELIFPLMTTGMHLKHKHKNDIFVPFEKSPKVAITTNYAINGNSSSHRRRMYEFEVSPTYSAEFTPRDKFNKNFFDGWNELEWKQFYNTMFQFLKTFLNEGLVYSVPINLQFSKLIHRTNEDFVEWADLKIVVSTQYDKRILYDNFLNVYPEYKIRLKQRDFTSWLRIWGEFKKFKVLETHSNNVRYITFAILTST